MKRRKERREGPDWLGGMLMRLREIANDKNADEDGKLRRFYEALLFIHLLSPGIRSAILKELGSSPRALQRRTAFMRVTILRRALAETKTRLKKQGVRNFRQAALDELADGAGMSIDALEKLFQRYKK
jgi:hypothetical protein